MTISHELTHFKHDAVRVLKKGVTIIFFILFLFHKLMVRNINVGWEMRDSAVLQIIIILQINKNKDVDIDGVVLEFAHL